MKRVGRSLQDRQFFTDQKRVLSGAFCRLGQCERDRTR